MQSGSIDEDVNVEALLLSLATPAEVVQYTTGASHYKSVAISIRFCASQTTDEGTPKSRTVPHSPDLLTPLMCHHHAHLKDLVWFRREGLSQICQHCALNAFNHRPGEEEHFLWSLAGALRRLPPHHRSQVKIKFQEILHKAQSSSHHQWDTHIRTNPKCAHHHPPLMEKMVIEHRLLSVKVFAWIG